MCVYTQMTYISDTSVASKAQLKMLGNLWFVTAILPSQIAKSRQEAIFVGLLLKKDQDLLRGFPYKYHHLED